ncbi:7-deoxyloganetin glucosyltransferase-like [Dorcoceras hygrometricum]|uniref:7-deoxyloganetin glucosyltransferase-like n=1 Tax=Dorcoceras hygrometricum TaxID=472368 RepID=A0A2Z7D0H9_9LAMI|nr:7-deoxyloganetin glucosyltransferase-like [Dorcoceras hygrometricum]
MPRMENGLQVCVRVVPCGPAPVHDFGVDRVYWKINISVEHLVDFRPDISYLLPESFRYELIPNPYCSSCSISFDCRQFTPPFGVRSMALSSSPLDLLIGTILETWTGCSRRCDESRALKNFAIYQFGRSLVPLAVLDLSFQAASIEFLGELVGLRIREYCCSGVLVLSAEVVAVYMFEMILADLAGLRW